MILVSACLLGYNFKYNGRNNENSLLIELLKGRDVRIVCPEVAGGLTIPRPPAEIIGGDGFSVWAKKAKVKTVDGEDVTSNYLLGSMEMLTKVAEEDIEFAVLKARSPACGSKFIYSGEFEGKLKPGPGVGAAFLLRRGIIVYNEEEINKIKEKLNR